ncbi:MAG: ABC transporter substrate-binding protein [Ideonella sp.]|nr:ABC transporter substrate-binding protein [Ideonella sp.]MCC7457748.1 ABC transporter substrate-binding protein [Nitrospira sp.]
MSKRFEARSVGAALAFGLAALCGQAFGKPTCTDGVIKVGAVSTITGVADFSEVPKATKAEFDSINAKGGIDGCKIDYTIADDKGDPQVAAQAARDLIDNKGVVAMVGSASLLDCQVNALTYQRKNVLAIQGLGVDSACFASPSVSPVNVGPFVLSTAMAYYASQTLKVKNVCAFFIILGGTQEAYKQALVNWEKMTGKKLHMLDLTVPIQGDLTPYLIKARDGGCDAVINNGVEPNVVQWVKTADAQKITNIKWLFLAPAYTVQVAKALADSKQPVYAGTEWEPYTESNLPANQQWIATMKAADRPLTAFSQGGYLAANVFVDVIKGINGPVNHDTVAKALRGMRQPVKYPLAGSPWIFGDGKTHTPMQSTKIMKLDNGAWKVETPQFVTLPKL